MNIALIAIERGRTQAELVNALEELRKSHEQLRRDEQEFHLITDAIAQIVVVMQPEGRIIYANRLALDYSGLTLEDVQPRPSAHALFILKTSRELKQIGLSAFEKDMPFENEQRFLRKDGKYRWFLHRYNPLLDDRAKVVRWYTTGTDIEDRKRAEDRVRNENVALREEIERSSMFEEIVGSSDALSSVLTLV